MDMSGDDFDRRFEVIAETRRHWSLAEKRRIVEEASGACTNISAVARHHGIKPALLYRWKKELGGSVSIAPALVPVTVTTGSTDGDDDASRPACSNSTAFMVEIELNNGRTIRVPQQITEGDLERIITVLER